MEGLGSSDDEVATFVHLFVRAFIHSFIHSVSTQAPLTLLLSVRCVPCAEPGTGHSAVNPAGLVSRRGLRFHGAAPRTSPAFAAGELLPASSPQAVRGLVTSGKSDSSKLLRAWPVVGLERGAGRSKCPRQHSADELSARGAARACGRLRPVSSGSGRRGCVLGGKLSTLLGCGYLFF